MLYQIHNGTKHYGVNDVFENINFEINENEKIALIGRNGTGKSTLMKIMIEEEELTSGNVHKNGKLRIGYLAQSSFNDDDMLLEDAMDEALGYILNIKVKIDELSERLKEDHSEKALAEYSRLSAEFDAIGGYSYQNELETLLTKFGFQTTDLKRKISSFSGGQKTRLAFVALLVSKPDILLLDEPTNHLDLKTIEWLEGYLKKYPKAILLISHDRVFMDNVVNAVYELEHHSLKRYSGNYTSFEIQKKNDQTKNHSAFLRQQKEIERLENLIEKFRYKASKAKFAQSKIKVLDKMEKIEDTKAESKGFKVSFTSKIKGGKEILNIDNLKIGYDEVLCNVNLDIFQKDRICIIGDNGCGKSTLLKTIVGEIKALGGYYMFGHQIEVGYFDQNLIEFNRNKTVIEEVWDEYPELDQTTLRTLLGNFLFSADDVFKNTSVLSGGEKVRLALVKLVLKRPNFLILDEPTNHLDIKGKQALEEALNNYDGTILMVSHDRYFIKQVAKSCLLMKDKECKLFPFGYNEYIDKEENVSKNIVVNKNNKPKSNTSKIRNLEKKINEIEEKIQVKKELMFEEEYYNDTNKLKKLENEILTLEEELDNMMLEWEVLVG